MACDQEVSRVRDCARQYSTSCEQVGLKCEKGGHESRQCEDAQNDEQTVAYERKVKEEQVGKTMRQKLKSWS